MTAPRPGSHEEHWYREGLNDEAKARKEGLSLQAQGLISTAESLARAHPSWGDKELAAALAAIYGAVEDPVAGPEPSPRIRIIIKGGVTAPLIMIPLDMVPLAPGSYDAELVVDE